MAGLDHDLSSRCSAREPLCCGYRFSVECNRHKNKLASYPMGRSMSPSFYIAFHHGDLGLGLWSLRGHVFVFEHVALHEGLKGEAAKHHHHHPTAGATSSFSMSLSIPISHIHSRTANPLHHDYFLTRRTIITLIILPLMYPFQLKKIVEDNVVCQITIAAWQRLDNMFYCLPGCKPGAWRADSLHAV